jgi:co-chaperonin GroES (HSP10)
MTITPLRDKVLLRLDPESRQSGLLHLPDEDYIAYCRQCTKFSTALTNEPCNPRNRWEWSPERQEFIVASVETTHEIEHVEAPVVNEKARKATVLAANTRALEPGQRVLVDFMSGQSPDGDPMSLYRIVHEKAVLARVEEP